MPQYEIEITTVSWIDKALMSSHSGLPSLTSDWTEFLAYGMCHTGNPTPPTNGVRGTRGRDSLGKQYRGYTDFSLQLQTASDGKFVSVRQTPNTEYIIDPGYTPPFDSTLQKWMGALGSSFLGNPGIPAAILAEAVRFSPGDKSILSLALIPDSQWRTTPVPLFPYSSLKLKNNEIGLGNIMLKFRAGSTGDFIGVMGMGAPNHLPWVWVEAALAYQQSNSSIVLYCSGSAFPCHAFYVNGKQVSRLDLTSKNSDLATIFTKGLKAEQVYVTIPNPEGRNLPPVPIGMNHQTSIYESWEDGVPVQSQGFTAPPNPQAPVRIEMQLRALP